MSRSRRKTPAAGVAHPKSSEKWDKQKAHRRHRRRSEQAVKAGEEILPDERETSDPWDYLHDGKQRFDPTREPKLMRK